MKIAITAESTIDLTKELLDKFEIKTVPFQVILGEVQYKDGEEISPSDIFKYVEEKKVLPKTSAINKEQYYNFFNEIKKDYDGIIHFSLSSGLSSSCQNAMDAAHSLENVYIVDTLSLSTGIALLAIYAKKLVDQGLEIKEIYDKVVERIPNLQASFVIEKLNYLHKGGRCSALSLFGANLMRIRPQIWLKDGKMGVHRKYVGKIEKVIENYCKDTLNEFNNPDLDVAFLTYTTASEGMIENAKKALQEKGFKNIYETIAGATVTSHCGEHTLGILYLNDGSDNH